ncbi:MAG: hydroxymethylglutaryl-CoA reductase, partial [Acidobacteriota bacterium]
MKIPSLVLRQLYTHGSLRNTGAGVCFSLKNRLSDAVLTGLEKVAINDKSIPIDRLRIELTGGATIGAAEVGPERPVDFPLSQVVSIQVPGLALQSGRHQIALGFVTKPFGRLSFDVRDSISSDILERARIPYSREDDYTPQVVAERLRYVESFSGVKLEHLARYSFEAGLARGNIENFTGVAQVPIGFAGPIEIDGQHARGDFLIPLATTEGTLVASYNRWMKVLNLSGGVKT